MSILSRQRWEELTRRKNLSGAKALKAVKQDGFNLRYVIDQTPEICLAAVKQNGYALQHVKEQTPAICLAAVKQIRDALRYVEERFLDDDRKIIVVNGKTYRLMDEE